MTSERSQLRTLLSTAEKRGQGILRASHIDIPLLALIFQILQCNYNWAHTGYSYSWVYTLEVWILDRYSLVL